MIFPKHILGLKYLDKNCMEKIFRETDVCKKNILSGRPLKKISDHKTVLNLFFEDSTRTRKSFELSEKKLRMDVVNFSAGGSSMSKGESLLDTIKNIDAMKFDYIVVRHPVPGIPELLTKFTTSGIINAGDGTNEHPTQGLLDIYTLRNIFGDLSGLNVCIVGNISHSRVALSNIFGLKKFNANVSVCGPVPFIPKYIEGLGVNVYTDLEEAVRNSDALNILRVQLEREAGSLLPSLGEFSKYYGITKEKLKFNPKIKILHPGPMNINVEIDHAVSVSDNSYVFEQVTNGVAVRCALFKLLNENPD